jgi:hypothetical protein
VRHQRVRGRVHTGPQGIHLISVRSVLRPDSSSSSSVSSFEKCDKAATNADRVPQRTPLAAMKSTQPSSSSTAMDRDAAREDGSSALSSTKSQTGWRSKEQVINPHVRPLKPRAPLL